MKKLFITGLIILLPVTLTLAILAFFVNLLTTPFLGIVTAIFSRFDLFNHGFGVFDPEQLQTFTAQILILVCLFFLTVGLGYLARWFFFTSLMRIAEYVVIKIPFVNTIYKVCQDVINTIFTTQTNSFKQVVLVRFPNVQSYSIGLITREDIGKINGTPFDIPVAVFVPTTPNPTSGFLVFFEKKDLVYLDMRVEDAFKYIISCGVIAAPFNKTAIVSKEITQELQELVSSGNKIDKI